MLHGLSVIDGSLESSVRWRRFWWRTAGVSLLLVAGTLLALTPIALQDHQIRAVIGLPLLAAGAFLAGGRLLLGARRTPRSLLLRRISIGLALLGCGFIAGFAALILLGPVTWDDRRYARPCAPRRDGSGSPGRLGPRASP